MSLLHSSTRPPPALTPRDYDHEIGLLDRTRSPTPLRSPSASARPSSLPPSTSPDRASSCSKRRHSDEHLHRRDLLRGKLRARRYAKFQDRREGEGEESGGDQQRESRLDAEASAEEERGRTMEVPKKARPRKRPEYAIDILYENQRGGFLCGIPLFSAKALGGLDPGPWTNAALKPSASDITNAQVPDPSWQWAWKDWAVNHGDGVDEDGWEYSFAFGKRFSWHSPHAWNSFVRRRAWIRKRVKKHHGYQEEAPMQSNEYFIIQPASTRSRSRASSGYGSRSNRLSMQSSKRGLEVEEIIGDIEDMTTLLHVLRSCRIDREKMEAVENFIEHGDEELCHLQERMHDIMRMFIFQASRRLLLAHLLKIFNEALDAREKSAEVGKEADPPKQPKLNHLAKAVKHAEEEVKKLEFWSDVKNIAESGATKGAVDEAQRWDDKWTGLDRSGPEDVISNRKLPGLDNCANHEANEAKTLSSSPKEKGKAKE
jgi:hypothetical protein